MNLVESRSTVNGHLVYSFIHIDYCLYILPGQQSQYGVIEGDFAMLMSLYHGYELLQQHGLRSLCNHLEGIVSGQKGTGRTRAELLRNHTFNEIMDYLRGKFETVK